MYMYFKDVIYKKICYLMKFKGKMLIMNNECIYIKQLNEYMIFVCQINVL